MDEDLVMSCEHTAREARKDILRMAYSTGRKGAHLGGGLSTCEILSTLYIGVMHVDVRDLRSPERDRFILSKGHGAIGLYAVLKQKGILSKEDLLRFKVSGYDFWTHPCFAPERGFEFASGSLGQGLALAAGTAIMLKRKHLKSRVYVYVGDGECDEGEIWESASFVAHHKLDNITVIVDENRLQLDDRTAEIVNKDMLKDRWAAFGFKTIEADGHDVRDLLRAFDVVSDKPKAIFAHTVKGKGVSFMENNPAYHVNVLNESQYKVAMQEQGVL